MRIWILSNGKSPSQVTINRFRNKIHPFIDEILTQFVELLIDQGEVNLKNIYIDGTKIEPNANKYTFIWKKSIVRYQEDLIEKIKKHFNFDQETCKEKYKSFVLREFNKIKNICKSKNIVFVHG